MNPCFSKLFVFTLVILSFWVGRCPAQAGCSQQIVVPSSPSGKFLVANEKSLKVSGVYPDLLRGSGKAIGCDFYFQVVPRARLNSMFEKGTGHLIIPETQTPERDRLGEFVPLFYSTPVIISARPDITIRNIDDIIKHPSLRVNVVRGYDWGDAYRAAIERLTKNRMVEYEESPTIIAKKMAGKRADVTIMSAHIMYGTIQSLGLMDSLGAKIQFIKTSDLHAKPSGAYISYSLSKKDRTILRNMMIEWLTSKELWKSFQETLPPEGLVSLTPLDKRHLPSTTRK